MGASPDILVLGGGIIGLATACELAHHGARVEVLSAGTTAPPASLAAAGMLAPLAETPHRGPYFDACRRSRDLWPAFRQALEAESGSEVGYDGSGAISVALDEQEAEQLEELAAAARAAGEPAEEIGLAEVARRVPDLSPRAVRAVLLPGEHRVDNVQAVAALEALAEKRGVVLRRGFSAERVSAGSSSVRVEGGGTVLEAAGLVLAAGAWSGAVPGLPALPVRPVRGQMLLLEGVDWSFGGTVRGAEVYTVRRGRAGLLVGATSEEAGFDAQPTLAGLHGLATAARRLLPGLAERRLASTWAGLRPATPDGLPLLGRIGDLPVFAATGHYRNGILLAPWTAAAIAGAVLDPTPPPDLAPFSPARFGF